MASKIILSIAFLPALVSQVSQDGLTAFDIDAASAIQIPLDKRLKEISGMAVHDDGRLFVHHDEYGDIFEIDPNSGKILKKFSIGISDDFEGLAVAENLFYLVTSSGVLYEFPEGRNNETVRSVSYTTSLDERYDVEGLCYDPGTKSLLLACKGYSGLKHSGYKGIFAFSLESKSLDREPRFLISLNDVKRRFGKKPFRPSGIEYHAGTQTFFILDSEVRSVVELSRNGAIIASIQLHNAVHAQPEGISFDRHGDLLIADEGKNRGTITRYKRKR